MQVKNFLKGALIMSMIVTSSAYAQNMQKAPAERAKMQLDAMQQNMKLTGDQSKKVYDIFLRTATENDKNKNMAAGPEKAQARQHVMNARDMDMKKVLTAEQYKQYTELKEKYKENAQHKMQ